MAAHLLGQQNQDGVPFGLESEAAQCAYSPPAVSGMMILIHQQDKTTKLWLDRMPLQKPPSYIKC